MRYWAGKLSEQDGSESQRLVELEPVGRAGDGGNRAPIELGVNDGYVLRLWPHVRAAQ